MVPVKLLHDSKVMSRDYKRGETVLLDDRIAEILIREGEVEAIPENEREAAIARASLPAGPLSVLKGDPSKCPGVCVR